MCGRYSLTARQEELARKFLVKNLPEDLRPRFNIAPSQAVTAIRVSKSSGERVATDCHWGLVPFWAKDRKSGYKMINARSETAARRPAYRAAMRFRRCLIPATGFYEWQRLGAYKQPVYFHHPEGETLAFAGLWEQWKEPAGGSLLSCTILTTTPNEVTAPVHNRMPVIIGEHDFDWWLDSNLKEAADVAHLLRPCPREHLTRYAVSQAVNNPRNDGPELIGRLDEVSLSN